jgi:hypothetical protein
MTKEMLVVFATTGCMICWHKDKANSPTEFRIKKFPVKHGRNTATIPLSPEPFYLIWS